MRCHAVAAALFAVAGCGGGSGGGDAGVVRNVGEPGAIVATANLTEADVRRVLAQGIDQAQALGAPATLAVVDRVGNVLATYRMAGSPRLEIAAPVRSLGTQPTGLDGLAFEPDTSEGRRFAEAAAVGKAQTGAYLSSNGNAFSTRTAGQIVQENFNPGELNQPAGPLFGVQFSQLVCSDFSAAAVRMGSVGPKPSALGLAADPGGFPLYKDGVLVGGVGVVADGRYSLDANILDLDLDVDEQVALAATFGFAPPAGIRADRITLDGKTLRFTDVEYRHLVRDPATAPNLAEAVRDDVTVHSGTVFGEPESGIRPAAGFERLDAFVFVDEHNEPRYSIRDGDGPMALTAPEVQQILTSALQVANRARSQIRRPLGAMARVTVAVVGRDGAVLGMLRSRDGPVFGADVALQKARTAVFFSSTDALPYLGQQPVVRYENVAPGRAPVDMSTYVASARAFLGPDAFSGNTAFTSRAVGNLARPFYPDGIGGNANGPFSRPLAQWSVFSTGLQLDVSFNRLILAALAALTASPTAPAGPCVGEKGDQRLANGMQIFPGGVPIYRQRDLVGAIGVSGDGVDQDDMVAFLGVHEAGVILDGSINNAPYDMRADTLAPRGVRLRYVQCPQSPFLGDTTHEPCAGK